MSIPKYLLSEIESMIRSASKTDAHFLAKLHSETLTTSFLAGLGSTFLCNLYRYLITKETVWIYEENNEIKGFVTYSRNPGAMMKRFIIKCPSSLINLMLNIIVKPANLKRFVETFQAPFKSKKADYKIRLPLGELLSISVRPNCQSSGIGSHLITALEGYLLQNNISQYKVVAGEELIGANKFYLKNGFVLATQINIHGDKKSNVYIKNIIQ